MGNPRYANGARRRALAARVRALGEPCHICGLPICYALPAGHPLACEVDELVPVSRGGSPTDPGNVAAAHRCCNQWRSNLSLGDVEAARAAVAERFGAWRTPQEFCALARSLVSGRRGPVRHPDRSSGAL